MKVTIIKEDNLVIVDGRPLDVDCSAVKEGIRAVQWDGYTGEVEWEDTNKSNDKISSIGEYNWLISAWNIKKIKEDKPYVPTDKEKEEKTFKSKREAFELSVQEPVGISVPEGNWVFSNYKGASQEILNEIDLADSMLEDTVILYDEGDNPIEVSHDSAFTIAMTLAKRYRDEYRKFKIGSKLYKDKIKEIKAK